MRGVLPAVRYKSGTMKTSFLILGLAVLLIAAGAVGYFLTKTETSDSMIVIDQPTANARISSPLRVTGTARGTWYFEATFPVQLTDASGALIAQTYAQAKGDWMTTEFVPFESTVTFAAQPSGSRGTLILKKDNPSGLSANDDSRTIEVIFK